MTPADIPAVVALAASLPAAPHWPPATYEKALAAGSLPRRIALVAADPHGAVAGFLIASLARAEAELESIAVATPLQRQGVARNLFRDLAILLAGHGVRTVFLEVRASNYPARSLYLSLGFAEAGRRKAYYAGPPEDAIVLRRALQKGGAPGPPQA